MGYLHPRKADMDQFVDVCVDQVIEIIKEYVPLKRRGECVDDLIRRLNGVS
jgi:hypothetical protein